MRLANNIPPQISPTNMRDPEPSDGEKTVSPVSRIHMGCKISPSHFGMVKS